MKAPYFKITAVCTREPELCDQGAFTVERERITYKSTDGTEKPITSVVCPICRMWAEITVYEKVAA